MTPIERIMAKVTEEGACLIWSGATDGRKTPVMQVAGKAIQVRRVMLEQKLGRPIRAGYVAARSCHEAMCVACVEEAAHRSKLPAKRGAFTSASKNIAIALSRRKSSRLDAGQIQAIRSAEGTTESIALQFGISKSYVGDLKTNRRRKDYSNPFAGLGA